MISIVIPLYNKEQQIRKTLESVFHQTYQNYEIIVVNDGSTDNSVKVVEDLKISKIRLINQENGGVSSARNRGIIESRGEYIAFLDADDEWDSTYLATQMELIKKYTVCKVFVTGYKMLNNHGDIYHTQINNIRFKGTDGVMDNYFLVAATSNPPICSINIVVHKSAIKEIGGFPIGIKSGEDLLTWARLAVKYPIAFCLSPNATYNLGEGYDYSNLPPRRQDSGDPVGSGLKKLYKCNHGIVGLRKYISHWHKMRASVAIRYGEKMETIAESCKSLYYNPLNYKVLPFIILSLIPAAIRKKIIVKFKG